MIFEIPLGEIPSSEEAEVLISGKEKELEKAVRIQDFREVRKASEELVRLMRAATPISPILAFSEETILT